MDRNETELHSHQRHSHSRTTTACDGRPDHVWTWIQACKYFLESSWSLLSYASNLKSISDVDINTNETSTPTHNQISGPITRARARQLNNQVSSFLASYSSFLDNRNMCSILLLRNDGQEQNGVAFVVPVAFGF
jgi:hypothetical protein